MTDFIDTVVIGAGVIGLSVARQFAMQGKEVLVLEAAGAIGTETSARNSEVIHSGIYYPKDSLKARLCLEGRRQLYAYCAERGVAHKKCGKLVVASIGQEDALIELYRKAQANGVEGVSLLGKAEVRECEPELVCEQALWSPETGIVDSHTLMIALWGDAENHGARVVFHTKVTRIEQIEDGYQIEDQEGTRINAGQVINCAGLKAQEVAGLVQGMPPGAIPKAYYAKGNYFSLGRRAPFQHLIYPLPDEEGLGIHLTLDLGGKARFGPDVQWEDADNYTVNPERAEMFYHSIRKYWPGLQDGDLQPDYAGIRPKVAGPGSPAGDFIIQGHADHGLPGLVNLYGIESPGLTSCLSVASYVESLMERQER